MSSPLFQRKLPQDRAARSAELRKYTPELPFFERYEAGDREGAWAFGGDGIADLLLPAGDMQSVFFCGIKN